MANWADVVEAATGRAVRDRPGAGAAGGLGAAFPAFLNCSMRPGVEIVVDAVALIDQIHGADWVFTGEGGINSQTLHGKTPWGVLQAARSQEVRVIMFGGLVAPEAAELLNHGVSEVVGIVPPGQPLAEALLYGPRNLADAVEHVVRRLVEAKKR